MKRILLILLSLILVLVIASAGAIFWLRHNQHWLKEQIQDYVTVQTGRHFWIDGSLELSYSLHPAMTVEGMRLGNAAWAEAADMLHLDRLRVSVELWSLLSNQIVFDFIELDGLAITFEENEQGDVNWELFPSQVNKAENKAPKSGLPVRIDRLLLNGMHLHHQAPNRLEALNAFLTSLPKQFNACGNVELGRDSVLLHNFEFDLGAIQARMNGSVDASSGPTSVQLSASIDLPSLSKFDGLMDRDFPDIPVTVNTSITGRGRQITVELMQAKLGSSDLSGTINLNLSARPFIDGRLRSNFLDVTWLTKSRKSEKNLSKPAARVFPDKAIPPIDFWGLNMHFNLSAERLKLDFKELSGVKLDLSLHDNYLHIDAFEFGGPLGERVSGKLAVDATADMTGLDFKMRGNQLRLKLATAENQDVSTFPQTDLGIELHGKGVTYHELAHSLNGQIRIVQGKGLIANAGLELLFSDFLTELYDTLNPYAQPTEYTELECSVINAEIKSGEILISPLIFHTEQVTILSEGNINLSTEQIDMIFETKVREGIGISMGMVVHPFIKLVGTLSSPSIELDPVGVAISGSIAVATYGLSLLAKSLFDRFLSSNDPCGEALQRLK